MNKTSLQNKNENLNENENRNEKGRKEEEKEEGEFVYDDNADSDEYSFALAPRASQALGYYGVQKGRDRDSEEKDGGEDDNED